MKTSEIISQITQETRIKCSCSGRLINLFKEDFTSIGVIYLSFDRMIARYIHSGVERIFTIPEEIVNHIKQEN